MRTNKKRSVKISTLWVKEVVNEKFLLENNTYFRMWFALENIEIWKFRIFNSIAYGVR